MQTSTVTHTQTLPLLPRDVYTMTLAPHHPWLIRNVAELVYAVLPDRRVFLDLVCLCEQGGKGGRTVLNIVIHSMREVHTRSQRTDHTGTMPHVGATINRQTHIHTYASVHFLQFENTCLTNTVIQAQTRTSPSE